MRFDTNFPFPASSPEEVSYDEVKRHAQAFDQWLGLNLESAELEIRSQTLGAQDSGEYWLHKPVDTFMTPYWDLDHMLREAEVVAGDMVIDLGAGYARLLFVLALRYPSVSFIGVEKVGARLDEARRVLNENSTFQNFPHERYQLVAADLRDIEIASLPDTGVDEFSSPEKMELSTGTSSLRLRSTIADRQRTHFFIYDFGSREDIEATLAQLQALALDQEVVVIARGGRSRDLIDRNHPWLSQVHAPKHFSRFSIYRS